MTETSTNFLGIPVSGDITKGSTRVAQRPINDLQPILQNVLNDSTIAEFGWHQYTPYFNDGDPCEFGVYTFWVRTTEDYDEELDDYELEVYGHPSLGGRKMTRSDAGAWVQGPYEGPDEARYDRVRELDRAIQGGEFEHVLLDSFGDHARITVRRDGVTVDYYEHD